MKTMLDFFKIGDEIENYCNGYFGRDDYEWKVCVDVKAKYAIFEYKDRTSSVLNISESLIDTLETCGFENWKEEDYEE